VTTFEFPYQKFLKEDGTVEARPVIRVFLQDTGGTWRALQAFVDSGSDISVFRKSDAIRLGLDLRAGEPIVIAGFGAAEIPAYIHEISIKVGTHEFACHVAFADEENTPPVIGREDFFNQFVVCYDDNKEALRLHLQAE
jgi:hypothetical protein